jgi:hypothetical protein
MHQQFSFQYHQLVGSDDIIGLELDLARLV